MQQAAHLLPYQKCNKTGKNYHICHIQKRAEHDVQSLNWKKLSKNFNFRTVQNNLNLEWIDKVCKYEMDPTSNMGDTERTKFGLQTDGEMNRRMDGQSETSIPLSTLLKRQINKGLIP